ncbi:hypothetical protein PGT21_035247 [Puccinia graminis f. sp. tritici]|uniref:Uncharacterized protein n=1 Tax=Puccinia graminis f. sp. tritici TaxID=56615 RepID=A0A5B0MYN6_PUCGR|nr:hypothetical protein PGT21_035247 [Puccinia graminis f. sp. tritici]KAA1130130.1 hypothetical protein PGTUg99_002392 [Puccinia graminis f. sp. tritici]
MRTGHQLLGPKHKQALICQVSSGNLWNKSNRSPIFPQRLLIPAGRGCDAPLFQGGQLGTALRLQGICFEKPGQFRRFSIRDLPDERATFWDHNYRD